MNTDFDLYDYIISIDIGTTYSGSCYSYINDNKSIVHVIKWPEQLENDTFEKTPTACLYSKENPQKLLKWGKAALDYVTTYPSDPNVILVDQFKLKLHDIFHQHKAENIFQETQEKSQQELYRTAAVDYLREIHQYTCAQLIRNVASATSKSSCLITQDKFRYVLTVPATWVNEDNFAMKGIALEAGLIQGNDPKERLVIISEAHAASLFCEREYCITDDGRTSKLTKGQRYLVCVAGGGTVDLATYECTGFDESEEKNAGGAPIKNGHCQLALESGASCGSTILDQNMEKYLREQVFIGCIEEYVLKSLVDQFVKEIKHYFGDNSGRNNFKDIVEELSDALPKLKIAKEEHSEATTLTTTTNTEMMNIHENDYKYDEDYEEYDSDTFLDDDEEENKQLDTDIEMDDVEDSCGESIFDDEESDDEVLSPSDYIYFTLPKSGKGIDQSILENLSLKGNVITTSNVQQQLRISHRDISKYVFDPVVEDVITLIRKQIKKSYTTIDTLFLLGGFGQSPYLYKKLHEEFITSTNSVNHLIVPEDGYRASMRGGIYFGIDCIHITPKFHTKDKAGNYLERPIIYNQFNMLVAIDFNFFDLTATYSFIKLNAAGTLNKSQKRDLTEKDLEPLPGTFLPFSFNSERFIEDYFPQLAEKLKFHLHYITQEEIDLSELYHMNAIRDKIYCTIFIKAFIQQLYEHIEYDFKQHYPRNIWNRKAIRYSASIASSSALRNLLPKNNNLSNTQNTCMDELKSYLLSKLLQVNDIIPAASAMKVHVFLATTLDSKSFSKQKRNLGVLAHYIFQAAAEVGMVELDDSENRIFWCGYTFKSFLTYRCFYSNEFPVDLVADTYIKKQNKKKDANNKSLSLKPSSIRPTCQLYTFDLNSVVRTGRVIKFYQGKEDSAECTEYKQYPLRFAIMDVFPYWTLRFRDTYRVLEDLKSGRCHIKTLVYFLVKETDFMVSTHLRNYIKNNIDLSSPKETHKLGDMFLINEQDDVMEMEFSEASKYSVTYVHDTIRQLRDITLTTEYIQNYLILPWIRNRLTPTIMELYMYHENLEPSYEDEEPCLLFTGEIVETKYNGFLNMPKIQDTEMCESGVGQQLEYVEAPELMTCAEFLFQVLKTELQNFIENQMKGPRIYRILYENNPSYSRHVDCIINAVELASQQFLTRISRRRYAIHFLNYNVKKFTAHTTIVKQQQSKSLLTNQLQQSTDSNTTQRDTSNADSVADNSDANNADKNAKEQKKIIIDLQNDILRLYPLISKDQVLRPSVLENREFYVENECYLAAVLYASDDEGTQENSISNNSFKKMHRFIFPIKDTSKPIIVSHNTEEYSILFTVKQDDYVADFRCNDILYLN